ncbi:MAG: hypothetical protein ABI620_05445 [Chloroflexota bacterium]
MPLDQALNFAKSDVSIGYNSAATSIVLATGGGAKFPTVPFNAVWYDSTYSDPADDPNVEIVRVTVISTDTLTITRAQEGTSAANHNTGGKTYKLIAGPTAKFVTDIGSTFAAVAQTMFLGTTSVAINRASGALSLAGVNVATATALATPRAINGVNFDGSAAITVPANFGNLAGLTPRAIAYTDASGAGGNAPLYIDGGLFYIPQTAVLGAAGFQMGNAAGSIGTSTNAATISLDGAKVGIGTTSPTGPLCVTANTGTLPAIIDSGVMLHGVAANAAVTRLQIDSFGAATAFSARRANGTLASPTGLVADDVIAQMTASGWTSAAAYSSVRGDIRLCASETWSGTNQGTHAYIRTTALGGTTLAERVRIDSSNLTLATGVDLKFPDATVQTTAYTGLGTLVVLKETVFAGIATASYTTGTTTTIDGCGYTCTISGNGTAAIVATGLRLQQGTTSGTGEQSMYVQPGNTGDFASLVGEARFRRGRWASWVRLASYAYTNASGNVNGSMTTSIAYPKWGVSLRRAKNLNGAPNTATGGIAASFWWNGTEPFTSSYPGVSTVDVWMAYHRSPEIADIYYGTYSGGWPTMESMTFMGSINMQTTQFVANSTLIAANVFFGFNLGGSAASSGTYELIFDRWRITTWE